MEEMDKKDPIQYLRECLSDIPKLAQLKHDNQEYLLWRKTLTLVVEKMFGHDSTEYRELTRAGRLSHIKTALDSLFESFDSSINIHQKDYLANLKSLETTILSIIKKYEILAIVKTPDISVSNDVLSQIFKAMKYHPMVIEASQSLFKDGHYAQAIFEAFKAINNFVKEKSGKPLDGKALMSKVFSEDKPVIMLNELLTQSDRDEQEGFKFLFMGAMVGIRNPKAHDNVIQTDAYRTLEYLSFASLLMKRVEEGKVVLLNKNV